MVGRRQARRITSARSGPAAAVGRRGFRQQRCGLVLIHGRDGRSGRARNGWRVSLGCSLQRRQRPIEASLPSLARIGGGTPRRAAQSLSGDSGGASTARQVSSPLDQRPLSSEDEQQRQQATQEHESREAPRIRAPARPARTCRPRRSFNGPTGRLVSTAVERRYRRRRGLARRVLSWVGSKAGPDFELAQPTRPQPRRVDPLPSEQPPPIVWPEFWPAWEDEALGQGETM